MTAVFPWLTYALLSDPSIHRKHRRLYDARIDAVKTLERQVQRRRKALMKTVDYPLPKARAKRKSR